jgi:hypothetical protein
MMHSHLTKWIEEADARQFCQDASWSRVSWAAESRSLRLGETTLKLPDMIVGYALACARSIAPVSRDVDPDRHMSGGGSARGFGAGVGMTVCGNEIRYLRREAPHARADGEPEA